MEPDHITKKKKTLNGDLSGSRAHEWALIIALRLERNWVRNTRMWLLWHLSVHLVKKELGNDKDNLIYVVFVILFYYLIFLVSTWSYGFPFMLFVFFLWLYVDHIAMVSLSCKMFFPLPCDCSFLFKRRQAR